MASMTVVKIRGVDMVSLSDALAVINQLTDDRDTFRAAAAANGRQLSQIRAALRGAPDSDLVSLARATYTASEMYQRLAGDRSVLRETIMRMIEGMK